MITDVTIEGMDSLRNRLEKIISNMDPIIDTALKATALEGEGVARVVEVAVKTGRLRSSIHFELKDTPSFGYSDNKGIAYNGSFSVKAGKREAFVGTNVEYAPQIEARLNFLNSAKNKMALSFPTFVEKYAKQALESK